MNELIWRKNNISLSKILDFSVFDESRSFKMSYFIKDTIAHLKLHLQLFIRGLGSIEMIYGQMLAQLVANISNLFLALLWRVEADSTPFYDFYNSVLGSVNFE